MRIASTISLRAIADVAGKSARDEIGAGRQRDDQRIEGADASSAGRDRRIPVRFGRRRRLSLGHAVDAIVHRRCR